MEQFWDGIKDICILYGRSSVIHASRVTRHGNGFQNSVWTYSVQSTVTLSGGSLPRVTQGPPPFPFNLTMKKAAFSSEMSVLTH
jgi:hypothetical protein